MRVGLISVSVVVIIDDAYSEGTRGLICTLEMFLNIGHVLLLSSWSPRDPNVGHVLLLRFWPPRDLKVGHVPLLCSLPPRDLKVGHVLLLKLSRIPPR